VTLEPLPPGRCLDGPVEPGHDVGESTVERVGRRRQRLRREGLRLVQLRVRDTRHPVVRERLRRDAEVTRARLG
jgi:hypothetical protein